MVRIIGYLKIDGIKGESQDLGHTGWIELLSISLPRMQPVAGENLKGIVVWRPSQDIVITKFVDMASPKLQDAVSTGKHFNQAVIDLKPEADQPGRSLQLQQVVISSLRWLSPSWELPMEEVQLKALEIGIRTLAFQTMALPRPPIAPGDPLRLVRMPKRP
jgi:type VI protein secretion system component Hcp